MSKSASPASPTPEAAEDWLSDLSLYADLLSKFVQGLERGDFRSVDPDLVEMINCDLSKDLSKSLSRANANTFAALAQAQGGDKATP